MHYAEESVAFPPFPPSPASRSVVQYERDVARFEPLQELADEQGHTAQQTRAHPLSCGNAAPVVRWKRPRTKESAMGRAYGHAQMLGGLATASHLATFEQLPALVTEHVRLAGWSDVTIYLADLQQHVLAPVTVGGPHADDRHGDRHGGLSVEGTVPGRAFQLGEILPAAPEDPFHWWVPLLDGTERIGVLHVTSPNTLRAGDVDTMQQLRELAALIAMLILSKRVTSDFYDRLVRRRRMQVAAEMEWRQMPPRTFATDRVMISALMEPAYEVSGDVFDYAFAGDTVYLKVFDAMGHDTAAGLTANLAVSTCRSVRRQGADIVRTAEMVERALIEQFGDTTYATGIFADLDTNTGRLHWLSRGHPPPVIIRDGRSVVHLECAPGLPMGVGLVPDVRPCHEQLQPGDRLLLYTDGMTEARNPSGREFGLDQFVDFLIRHHADGLPVPETLRRLIKHHLDYHGGRLRDDATVLVLEWHGPRPYGPGDAEALVGLPDNAPAFAPHSGREGRPSS